MIKTMFNIRAPGFVVQKKLELATQKFCQFKRHIKKLEHRRQLYPTYEIPSPFTFRPQPCQPPCAWTDLELKVQEPARSCIETAPVSVNSCLLLSAYFTLSACSCYISPLLLYQPTLAWSAYPCSISLLLLYQLTLALSADSFCISLLLLYQLTLDLALAAYSYSISLRLLSLSACSCSVSLLLLNFPILSYSISVL